MKDGLNTIRDERKRQIEHYGFTHEKDDLYTKDELLKAATCYLMSALSMQMDKKTPEESVRFFTTGYKPLWPFSPESLKITTINDCLRKAGGLLVAEMDRREREYDNF